MYIPSAFKIEDGERLRAFIEANAFATVISESSNRLFASHLPLLLEGKPDGGAFLSGHLALANPQSRDFETGKEVLCVFQGPHSYISPAWYQTSPAVPTWNYAAVHVYGRPSLITDQTRLAAVLDETIRRYEGGNAEAYQVSLPPEYRAKMMKGIVGFQITISRIEGKFKLGQNRSPEDVASVYEQLRASSSPDARGLADFMREQGFAGQDKELAD